MSNSNRKDKRYSIKLPNGRTVSFAHPDYENYTLHKDNGRKIRYLVRHKKRENWSKSGINTAGFWSRWLLWNKESI